MNTSSPILIIGPGSLGVGVGFRLSKAGFKVQFLARTGPCELKATVISEGKSYYVNCKKPTELELSQTALVFVAVKAYDLEDALMQHAHLLPKKTPVISLSNGAIEDVLIQAASILRLETVRLGITTIASSRLSSDSYALRNKSEKTIWGPLIPAQDDPTDAEENILTHRKLSFEWSKNPKLYYQKKWLFNSVINSISAVKASKSNGQLLKEMPMLQNVFSESYELGSLHWGQWPQSKDSLFQELIQLISETKDNENSMACDLRLGRKTETQFMLGVSEKHRGFSLLKSLHREIKKNEP